MMNQSPWEVEPPTDAATTISKRIYAGMAECGLLLPHRVIDSGAGGVAFCFFNGDRYADMEFLNTGDLVASTADRQTGEKHIWEFTEATWMETARRIHEWMS